MYMHMKKTDEVCVTLPYHICQCHDSFKSQPQCRYARTGGLGAAAPGAGVVVGSALGMVGAPGVRVGGGEQLRGPPGQIGPDQASSGQIRSDQDMLGSVHQQVLRDLSDECRDLKAELDHRYSCRMMQTLCSGVCIIV